jgi:putative endonuclease
MDNNYYIYILLCADNSYYTGVTNNLERRIAELQAGTNRECYTYTKWPISLVYSEHFTQIEYAIKREKQIKGWSRVKKEALIKGKLNELPQLSKNKQNVSKNYQQILSTFWKRSNYKNAFVK